MESASPRSAPSRRFGVFAGVLAPAMMPAVAVLLHERIATIVDTIGALATAGLVLAAAALAAPAALALASMATRPKGSKAFLTQTLGVPLGGSIALLLMLTLICLASLQIVGLAEALLREGAPVWIGGTPSMSAVRIAAWGLLAVVGVLVLLGPSLSVPLAVLALALGAVALVSLWAGGSTAPTKELDLAVGDVETLGWAFTILFAQQAGFAVSALLGAPLVRREQSLPNGLAAAIGMAALVTVVLTALLATRALPGAGLPSLSRQPGLVIVAEWLASLAAALLCITGASRLASDTALDGVLAPALPGRRFVPGLALIGVLIAVALTIVVADLDRLAVATATLALGSCGMLSVASALERWASPDYRPHYRVPAWVGATGAFGAAVALAGLGTAHIAAAAVPAGLAYVVLRRRQRAAETAGETWAGVWSAVVRYGLERLGGARGLGHRGWRPNMIAVSPENARAELVELARMIVGGRGILTHYTLVDDGTSRPSVDESLQDEHEGLFARIQGTSDPFATIPELARAVGFAGMETNSVMLEWPRDPRDTERWVGMLRSLIDLDVTVMCLRWDPARGFGRYAQVDLWWDGREHAGQLVLSVAHLLRSSDKWSGARFRVLVVPDRDWDDELARRALEAAIAEAKVDAEPVLLAPLSDDHTIDDRISRESVAADLVVVGLPTLRKSNVVGYVARANKLVRPIGSTLLVRAARADASTRVVFRTRRAVSSSVGAEVAFTLPTPNDAGVGQAVRTLEQRLRVAIERFEADVIAPSEAEERVFARTRASAVEQFRQLERRLPAHSARRFVVRAHVDGAKGRFAAGVVRQTQAFTSDADDSWRRRLERGLDALRQDIDDAVALVPVTVSLRTNVDDWKGQAGDPWTYRVVGLAVRFGAALGVEAPARRVPIRALADYHFRGLMLDGIAEGAVALGLRRFEALRRVRSFTIDVERFFGRIQNELELDASTNVDMSKFRDLFRGEVDGLAASAERGLPSEVAAGKAAMVRAFVGGGAGLDMDLASPAVAHTYRWDRSMARAIVRRRRTDEGVEALPNIWARQHRSLGAALVLDVKAWLMAIEARRAASRVRDRIDKELESGPAQRIADAQSIMAGLEDTLAETNAVDAALSEALRVRLVAAADGLRATWDRAFEPEARELIDALLGGLGRASDQVPVTVHTSSDEALEAARDGVVAADVVPVPARRLAQAFLEEAVGRPATDVLRSTPAVAREAERKLVDACRLVAFEIEHVADVSGGGRPEASPDPASLLETVRERIPRLSEAAGQLEGLQQKLEDVLVRGTAQALVGARQAIGASYAAGPTSAATRTAEQKKGRRAPPAGPIATRLRALRWGAAQRSGSTSSADPIERIRGLREGLSIDPDLLASLPLAYRRLFGRTALDASDLAVGHAVHLSQARAVIDRWAGGTGGPLAIVGAPRSGRTTMANLVARALLGARPVFRIHAPGAGPGDADAVNAAILKALGAREGQSGEGALRALPPGAVVVVDDLGRWVERRPGGLAALDLWTRLWRRLGSRHLFVVTATDVCWRYGGMLAGLPERFSGAVQLSPLAADDVGALIRLRQETSGLDVDAAASGSRGIGSQARLLRALTRVHQISGGNIGHALDLWRRSIVRFFDDRVTVVVRSAPDVRALEQIPVRWAAALAAVALHRTLNVARATRVLRLPRAEAIGLLVDLERAMLLQSDRQGTFSLDPVLGQWVLRALRRRGEIG